MPLHEQVAALAMLALVVLGARGWIHVVAQWRRGQPLIPYEPRRPVPWNLLDLLAILGTYLLIQMAAAFALRSKFGGEIVSLADATPAQVVWLLAAQAVASLATAGFAGGVAILRAGATWRDLGISATHLGQDVALGVKAFFVLALPVFAIQALLTQWFPSEHPLVVLLRENPDGLLFAMGVFVAVAAAPLVEEVLFRVLLQGWLERVAQRLAKSNPWEPTAEERAADRAATWGLFEEPRPSGEASNPDAPPAGGTIAVANLNVGAGEVGRPSFGPILASAGVFALLHLSHGPDPIPLFLLAMGLGYLYRQTHRLLPSLTVHLLLNATSMALLWMELTFGK